MRVNDLERALEQARDDQPPGDVLAARRVVDGRVRRTRAGRAVAICTAFVVLGIGVAVAARGNDSQEVISASDGLPHYLPDPLPAGTPTVQLYPIDEATTGTAITPDLSDYEAAWTSDPSAKPGPGSPILRLRVTRAPKEAIAPQPVESQTFGDTVISHWVDDLGWEFFALGKSVDPEQYAASLASVRLSADDIPTLTPPPGFRQVASYFESAEGWLGVFDSSAPGYIASFGGGDDRITPAFGVSARPSSHAWLLAYFEFENVEPTTIRDRPGYLRRMRHTTAASSRSGQPFEYTTTDLGVMLFWWESDGLLLATIGATEDEARAMAEAMREVGEEEWDAFLASAGDPAAGPVTTTVP